MRSIEVFKRHLREKRAIKIISSIDNYNLDSVKKVVSAAQMGLASAVDVACDKEVFEVAAKNTTLPIFVSSIHPFKLAEAVKWGADAIEIGNFDALYKKGETFSADEVYEIALETMSLVEGKNIFICVTIPGNIDIKEQIELAKNFELLGVDLIQTEGMKPQGIKTVGAKALLETAQATIGNTLELSRHVSIPVMSASGISAQTTPLAFAAGASAVGVGSAVNKLDTQIEMVATIRNIVASVAYRNSINKEIARNHKELELFAK